MLEARIEVLRQQLLQGPSREAIPQSCWERATLEQKQLQQQRSSVSVYLISDEALPDFYWARQKVQRALCQVWVEDAAQALDKEVWVLPQIRKVRI